MRIGLVASVHHPVAQPFAGGTERHTHLLATELRRRGHHVLVFAGADSDPALDVVPVRRPSSPLRLVDAVRDDPNGTSDRVVEEHHLHLGLMQQLDEHDLDVVHLNSVHWLSVAMAPSVATPLTMTLHRPPTPWLRSALVHAGVDRPGIIAVSRATARAWADVVAVDAVVPNGVDLDAWRPLSRQVGDHVVWVGRVVPEKDPLAAVEAARLAGRHLVVAGPLDHDTYGRRVLRALDGVGTWAGHLDDDELREVVGTAAVALVTPAWEEPYGLVAAEALALGTPVAGYHRGGVPEVVDPTSGMLVPGGDVAGLAAAIDVAAGRSREGCRRRAEEVADHRRMVDAYLDVLAAAAAGRSVPRGDPRTAAIA